jgi:ATP-dependent Clp protease ATP-binding subunit ClpB
LVLYLSSESSTALTKAGNMAKEMKDDFISIEHILLGIMASNGVAAKLMMDKWDQ